MKFIGFWILIENQLPRPLSYDLLFYSKMFMLTRIMSQSGWNTCVFQNITKCVVYVSKRLKPIFLDPYFQYEGCSNMNASGFITFFTYMLRQNGKRFHEGLYVTFQVAPDQKKNTVYLLIYSPLNEGHVCILTNSML